MPGFLTLMRHDLEAQLTAAITTNVGCGLRQHCYATGIHAVMDALVA